MPNKTKRFMFGCMLFAAIMLGVGGIRPTLSSHGVEAGIGAAASADHSEGQPPGPDYDGGGVNPPPFYDGPKPPPNLDGPGPPPNLDGGIGPPPFYDGPKPPPDLDGGGPPPDCAGPKPPPNLDGPHPPPDLG